MGDGANAAYRKKIEAKKRVILQNADNYVAWLNSPSLKLVELSEMMSSTLRVSREKSLIEKLRQVKPDIEFEKLEATLDESYSLVTVWLNCPEKNSRYLLFF